jgi:hypothetical protein
MKKFFMLYILVSLGLYTQVLAQTAENYGKTLNIGLGVGYYGFAGHSAPAVTLNYEFDIHRNMTLAPFIGFYTYSDNVYWGDPYYAYRSYSYRETIIPIGAKFVYYFDDLLHASSRWDFYGAVSAGFAIRMVSWSNGYNGDKTLSNDANVFLVNLHLGARYHLNNRTALFLDLSTGVSTVGASFLFEDKYISK